MGFNLLIRTAILIFCLGIILTDARERGDRKIKVERTERNNEERVRDKPAKNRDNKYMYTNNEHPSTHPTPTNHPTNGYISTTVQTIPPIVHPPIHPPNAIDGTTVVDLALTNDAFSILVAALTTANLIPALSTAGPFTVFAPTNDAFIALINALGITAEELLAIPSLPNILLYHVVSGYLTTADLATMSTVHTLNGQTIAVEGDTNHITLTSQQGGKSNIIIPNLKAANGIVHAVDAVLLPLFETVVDIALSFDDFSLLVAALDHTGLVEPLLGPGPFTVFAPPNSAFEALMAALNINVNDLLAIPSLQDILLYHVVGDFLLTHDLMQYDGQSITTLTSDGQTVEIKADGTAISVLDQQGGSAQIVLPDVQAKNGVVHVIDAVMLPLFDTVKEIAESFDAFSILVKAVETAGLCDALESEGPFTVFAPNNEAFAILLDALGVTIEDILKMPTLQNILLYHVIGDFLLTSDLSPGSYVTLIPDGQAIRIAHDDSTIQVLDNQMSLTGIAKIILPNVQAKNGVAHVIDRVLLPLFDTVVQIAASFDKFSILVDAVVKAGLVEALSGPGPFTVFAPPNEAFVQLMSEIHIDIDDLLNIPQLADILLYHVVGDFILTPELKADHPISLKTLNGQIVKSVYVHQSIKLIDAQSDVSNIGLADVKAKNGVAHVIDRVLIPLFDSIVQVATSFKDYSILVTLVKSADMIQFLQGPGPFTVFAPNNKAFEKLMMELRVNLNDLIRLPTLKRVLKYHMVGKYVLAKDLETRDYNTLSGQDVFVNTERFDKGKSQGFIVDEIHLKDQQDMKADVLFGNVEAMNGVVHVIQRVMIPMFDSVMQIAESFADYSILVRLVHCAGLTDQLRAPAMYTVFAPNNRAFGQLMHELNVNVDDLCRLPMLRDVLWYHIHGHWLTTSDLGDNKEFHQKNGQYLKVYKNDHDHMNNNNGFAVDGITLMDQQSDYSNIIIGNVQAKNGIVHVVDRVLILLFESVIEIGYAIDDYSILMRCLEVADLIRRYDRGGPWTVFAPTNRAFHILMDQLLIDIDQLYDLLTLRIILQNHVIPGYYLRSDLERVDNLETDHGQRLRFYPTHDMRNNENHNNGGGSLDHGFYIDGIGNLDPQNDPRNIFIGNAEAKNGVVHVVDRVNVILFDSIMQIARSIRDYTLLVRVVEEGGINPMLSDPSGGPYTVFAPNNRAFNILMDELLINFDDLLNLPNLDHAVLYHIIPRHLLTPDLSKVEYVMHQGQEIYPNANHDDKYTGYDVTGVHVMDQQHDDAKVIIGNIEAKNGVVHVVDRVCILLFESVLQVADYLPNYYSMLSELVYTAGIDDMLHGPGTWTVFAPNNDAFEKLFAELHIDLDDLKRMPLLKEALFTHIIDTSLLSSELPNGPLENLMGQSVFTDTSNSDDNYNGFAVRDIAVTDMQQRTAVTLLGNVETKNGVVHVIDRVMILLFPTVVDVAQAVDDYSILVQLVVAADMVDALTGPGPFTVFAPNNDAFNQLMDELHITIDDLLKLPILVPVLLYHVLDGYYISTQLPSGDTQTMNEQTLHINKDNYDGYVDGFDINGIQLTDQQSDLSNVFIGNIQTGNGVVFVVDRVLIPLFESIVQVATSFDDYSILVQLVLKAGLAETLAGPGPWTAFAPNNDAFYKLMDELLIDLDDLLNLPSLTDVLLYHVVNDYWLRSDLSTGDMNTMLGQTMYLNTDEESMDYGFRVTNTSLTDQQQRESNVFIGNVEASNGVVFVIDRVMIPMFESIAQIATSFDDYSILVQLVVTAGLEGILSDPDQGPFTVFAPNNDAFYNLMDELRITVDDLLQLPSLINVLLYHVLSGHLLTTDLSTGPTQTLNGQNIHIDTSRYTGYTEGFDVIGISLTDGQYHVSNMFIGNVQSNNGVVHVVDRVMIPLFDHIAQIATSFDDYSILLELVVAAGLDAVLSNPDAGPFTVFAPNNYAFYQLMDELDVTLDDLVALPDLVNVLLYHVLPAEHSSYDLHTANYTTMNGQPLGINTDHYDGMDRGFELVGISVHDAQGRDASCIIGNIRAQNGIVHVIDTVMLPMFDTVIDIALSFDDFSLLVAAVTHANLTNALLDEGPFTVFAPPNHAFGDLMNKLHVTVDDLLSLPSLSDVLLYHVVADYITYAQLTQAQNGSELTTLQGQTLLIYHTDSETVLMDQQGSVAMIDPRDVQARNGIVHVIDTVLLPLFESIAHIATSLDAFSILVAALNKAGLANAMLVPGSFTVFAPDNTAFTNLMTRLGLTLEELLELNILTDVLLYHVVGDAQYSKQDLIDLANEGAVITTLNGDTLVPKVVNDSDVVLLSANGASFVIISDVYAKNGVAHVIDRVLLPPFDTVMDVASNFDDFSLLVDAVNYLNLSNALSGKGPFTVFAPHNDAFDDLMNKLHISIQDLLNLPSLHDVLMYHVVSDYMLYSQLTQAQNGSELITLQGQTLQIYHTDSETVLMDQQGSVAMIDPSDVRARNGIVHVIDTVMLPLFETIADIATSLDAFSILVAAIRKAGLTNAMLSPGLFTVFAPTNNAFYELVTTLGITLDELLELDILRDVLLYHVVSDEQYSKRDLIEFANDNTEITAMNGDTLSPKVVNDDVVLLSANGASLVIIADVYAQNGVVHVIDRVMLPPFDTVMDVAASFDDFSLLVAAVHRANLTDEFLGDGPFTVFAPHNDAFEDLMNKLHITMDDLLNLPNLHEVLLYHVVPDYMTYSQLTQSQNGSTLSTLQGDAIQIFHIDSETVLMDPQGSVAMIDPSDVRAQNGIVHVIDTVMLPLFESIAHIATALDAFSILVSAIHKAGLAGAMISPGPFTVFAPTNDAFHALATTLGITVDDLLELDILRKVVLYHVVSSEQYNTPNLIEFAEDNTPIYTMNGQSLSPKVVNGDVVLLGANGAESLIIIADVYAKNGVAHVIDRVLLPAFDSVMDVATTFDSFSILLAVVNQAGAIVSSILAGDGPFTIFAPTNAAFYTYLNDTNMNMTQLLGSDELMQVLLYHCVNELYTKDDLNGVTITTKNGETIDAHVVNNNDVILYDKNGGVARIIIPDVVAKNGIVHAIDRVLVPFTHTVLE